MKRYTIEQKFKSAAAFLVILILFPYIVSVFVNGVDPEETTNENFYIRVKASEEEEADGIAEVEWNEMLFWRSIICRRRKCRINGLPMNIKSDMKNTEMP